jgi:hypothetical protein
MVYYGFLRRPAPACQQCVRDPLRTTFRESQQLQSRRLSARSASNKSNSFFSASLAASWGTTPPERRAWRDSVYEVMLAMTASRSQGEIGIECMCRLTGISGSGYYRHRQRSAPRQEQAGLRDAIQCSASSIAVPATVRGRSVAGDSASAQMNSPSSSARTIGKAARRPRPASTRPPAAATGQHYHWLNRSPPNRSGSASASSRCSFKRKRPAKRSLSGFGGLKGPAPFAACSTTRCGHFALNRRGRFHLGGPRDGFLRVMQLGF